MTITWRGLGYLGFMIPLALLAVATALGGVNNFKGIRFAMVVSAAIVWFLGTKLNGDERDEEDKPPHLTFGYPLQWSAGLSVAGFLLTFA